LTGLKLWHPATARIDGESFLPFSGSSAYSGFPPPRHDDRGRTRPAAAFGGGTVKGATAGVQ